MRLACIQPGDLIHVNKGGRHVYAKVVEIRSGVVQFEPLCRGVSYRHASAREIIEHWRKSGAGVPARLTMARTPNHRSSRARSSR